MKDCNVVVRIDSKLASYMYTLYSAPSEDFAGWCEDGMGLLRCYNKVPCFVYTLLQVLEDLHLVYPASRDIKSLSGCQSV